MAVPLKAISILFGAIDNVTPSISTITNSLGALDTAVSQAAEVLGGVADKIIKIETGIVLLGTAMTGLSIKTAGEFSDSFNSVSTLFDASAKSTQEFRNSILEYSRTSTSSMADITNATYQAISAGQDHTEVLSFLTVAEQAASAGATGLETSVDSLTSVINAYGKENISVNQASDVFFTTIKAGKTTFSEMGSAISDVLPTAVSLKIPFTDVGAAIATITSQGATTSSAVTSLNALFSSMLAPSEGAKKAAKALGIELGANAVKANGFTATLDSMIKATNGDAEAIFKLVGRKEALSAALILGTSGAKKFNETLGLMKDAAGETEKAYLKMEKNFEAVNQTLVNNVQATLIEAGLPLLAQYGDTVTALSKTMGAVSLGLKSDAFKPVFDAINNAGLSFEQTLDEIAKNLPKALEGVDFSDFARSFEELGAAFKSIIKAVFGKDIDLTSVNGLRDAIQLVVDSITNLTTVSTGIVENLKPVFSALGGGVKGLASADEQLLKSIGVLLGQAKLINDFGTVFGTLMIGMAKGGVSAGEVFSLLQVGVQYFILNTKNGFQTLEAEVLSVLGSIAKGAGSMVFWDDSLSEKLDKVGSSLKKSSDAVATTIRNENASLVEANIAWENHAGTRKKIIGGITDAVEEMANTVDNSLKSVSGLDVENSYEQNIKDDMDLKLLRLRDLNDYKASVNKEIDSANARFKHATESGQEILPSQREYFDKQQNDRQIQLKALNRGIELEEQEVQKVADRRKPNRRLDEYLNNTSEPQPDLFSQRDEERETQRRKDNLQRQRDQAIIGESEAKIEKMASGSAFDVNINAENLAPHLEGIWEEIVKTIQIRASEEGAEMLVGV